MRFFCLTVGAIVTSTVMLAATRVDGQPADKAAAAAAAPPAPAPVEDLNVDAVLETNPTTPAELVRAIVVLIDLNRADAARPLLKKLVDANIDEGTAAQLYRQFGPAAFLKIALARPLAPQGKAFGDRLLAAVRQQAQAPERTAELIKELGDPSPRLRTDAFELLLSAGPTVVNPLVRALADPGQTAAHTGALLVLSRLGSDAVGPLLGLLESPDPNLAGQAAMVLARDRHAEALNALLAMAYRPNNNPDLKRAAWQAVSQLVGRVPTREKTAALFERQASEYLAGRKELPHAELQSRIGLEATIQVWHWDEKQQASTARRLSPRQVRSALASQMARDAFLLTTPDEARYGERRRLCLVATLNAQPASASAKQALAAFPESIQRDLASSAAGTILAEALDLGLLGRLPRAARLAARLLGQAGDSSLLTEGGEPCSLVRALADPDRGVRFEALSAIMELKHSWHFAGASQVPIAVAWFIATTAVPKAVVAADAQQEAGRMAGLLAELSYEAATATNGEALLREATASSDVEVILVDATLLNPLPIEAIALLRQDPRTAALPIALVVTVEEEPRFRGITRRDPLTRTIILPQNSGALGFELARLAADTHTAPPSADERLSQARQAIPWAVEIASTSHGALELNDLISPLAHALFAPQLAAEASTALAVLGNPRAQIALADFVSQHALPRQPRQAAAAAFCDNVARYGVLLTSGQLQLQLNRYEESQHLDAEEQELLGSMLACLKAGRAPVARLP